MSEKIDLKNSTEIRDWIQKNGFDVVSLESDSPRFFQPRFTPSPGPLLLYKVEHTFLLSKAQPTVSVQQNIRAASAEDALFRYLQEPKEHATGSAEYHLGFTVHHKPGTTDFETISISRLMI
jgi:hypothetical protein